MERYGKRLLTVLSLLHIVVMVTACETKPSVNVNNEAEPNTLESTKLRISKSSEGKIGFSSDNGATANISVETKSQLTGMEPMQENESLQLYINRTTTEIAVLDKQSAEVWFSNPTDRAQDGLATPYIKGKLSSQVSLVYLTHNGQTKEYDSFNDSVQYKQFKIQQTDRGLIVTYAFGKQEKGIESIPQKISKKRFEENLLNRLEDPDDKDEIVSRFKLDQNMYERREIPKVALQRVIAIFEKAGYTEEDLAFDNQENNVVDLAAAGNAKFTVALQYSLDGDTLVATIDTTSIKEESEAFKIHSIGILDNFGAANKQDEGYIFVPDGSGSLVYLNNGKTLAQPIIIPIYGEDGTISKDEKMNSFEVSRMPVFGLKKNDSAFFGIIEEGDALAKVTADVSGRVHGYNLVNSQFTVLSKDSVKLSNQEEMIKTPKQMHQGKLQIRYAFLSGEQANYSGMAAYYRNYLEKKFGMKKVQAQGDIPFYLELVGSVPKKRSFLGIPYESLVPLSDFEQTAKLVEQLNSEQIQNIHLNYKGWFNEGLRHKIPSNVSMDSVLGNEREWRELSERLKKNGGGLYPDVAFLRVYQKSGEFSPSKHAAQFISRKYTKIFNFDPATFQKDHSRLSHYILSPSVLEDVVADFLANYKKLNPQAISLRDLGTELNSDLHKDAEVTREEAKRIIVQQTKLIHEQAPNMMLNGGNVYLLPFASHVLNVPQISNQFQISGESIPFYQMVVHGYVEYTSKPFNLADDQDLRKNVLKSLETGSNVYYSWICVNPSILKDTDYDDLYSNYYKYWLDEAIQAYQEVNAVLKQVRGQSIISHQKLAEGVYETIFENGKSVTVNYRNEAVNIDGVTIQAEHYYLEG